MIKKLIEINKSSKIEMISKILILVVTFLLITILAIYFSTKMSFENPLIPKYLAFEVFYPYAQKGFILSIGLFFALISKFIKQNLITLLICIIIIAIYFLTSFEPDFTNYRN